MYIVENYGLAITLCVITMLCWGSWANTTKLTTKTWRFELFYWDYGFGILITTLLLAFTLGSYGNEGRSFMNDFGQADNSNLFSAFIGGVIFQYSDNKFKLRLSQNLIFCVLIHYFFATLVQYHS